MSAGWFLGRGAGGLGEVRDGMGWDGCTYCFELGRWWLAA